MSTGENTQSREATSTNWDALTNAYEGTVLTETKEEKPAPVVAEEVESKSAADQIEKTEEVKIQDSVSADDLKSQAKELGLPETATKEEIEAAKTAKAAEDVNKPLIEFTPEDVKGHEKEPEDGTWSAVAKAVGVDIQENSFDAFKDALIAPYVKQAENAMVLAKEHMYANLKPETVTAFKLLEMGIPEEQLFHPTRQIEEYLKYDDSELVRADLDAMGWKPEMVDAELELLTEKNLLGHQAQKIRFELNQSKDSILKQREDFVQQYESKRQEAIEHQKEQEKTHFEKAANNVSTFMGQPIPAGVKDAIIKNYNKGLYDNDLGSVNSKVEYVLYKELGQKVLNVLVNSASQKEREENRKKQLEVPPVTGNNAGQVQQPTKQRDNWSAVEEAFQS